jgi:hypothetical protein
VCNAIDLGFGAQGLLLALHLSPWPDDAGPYDHYRSLLGVAEILEEYIQTRWESSGHLGLEVLAKTIRQSANALDEHFKISESVTTVDSTAAPDNEAA